MQENELERITREWTDNEDEEKKRICDEHKKD